MAKEAKIMTWSDVKEKTTHGGSATARIILNEDTVGINAFSLLVNTMTAGLNCAHDTPGHSHTEEHALYILEGHGGVSLDGKLHEVGPHDTVYIPPGIVHYVYADPGEDLTYLVLYSPAGHEKSL